MISIIISSRSNKYLVELEQNIANTIGVQFEIIKIDNPGLMGICEAYNRGAQRAKYDIFCFAHEDIEFQTQDWGKIVLRIFKEQPEIGLLGVAGNIYKSITPSHWSFPEANKDSFFMNVAQDTVVNSAGYSFLLYSNPKKTLIQKVAAVDGFWFCVPKKVAEQINFDAKTCPGFHGYDVDFSLAVQQKYTVAVTFEILITHFSTGSFNKDWVNSTLKVHKKWKKNLPILIEPLTGFNQRIEEEKALISFMKKMVENNFSPFQIIKLSQFKNSRFKFSWKCFLINYYRIIRYDYYKKIRESAKLNAVVN